VPSRGATTRNEAKPGLILSEKEALQEEGRKSRKNEKRRRKKKKKKKLDVIIQLVDLQLHVFKHTQKDHVLNTGS
jgi:hypothetical protein